MATLKRLPSEQRSICLQGPGEGCGVPSEGTYGHEWPPRPFQLAYKAALGTETALLKVQNDILRTVETGGVTVLVLLDLSAAFDTIDHVILLERLRTLLGIDGRAHAW